jgi:hypothetical protein
MPNSNSRRDFRLAVSRLSFEAKEVFPEQISLDFYLAAL